MLRWAIALAVFLGLVFPIGAAPAEAHTHAQCLASAPALAAVQAATDAAKAACESEKAALQAQHDAVLQDLRLQHETDTEALRAALDQANATLDAERAAWAQERAALEQRAQAAEAAAQKAQAEAAAGLQGVAALDAAIKALAADIAALKAQVEALKGLVDAWQNPKSTEPVLLSSKVAGAAEAEITPPAGAVQVFARVHGPLSSPGKAENFPGQWTVWPDEETGKVRVTFAGYRPGLAEGVLRFHYAFADRPPLDVPIQVSVEEPLTLWPSTAPAFNTGTPQNPDKPVTLGVVLKAEQDTRIVGMRYYCTGMNPGVTRGFIRTMDGAVVNEAAFEPCLAPGWVEGYFHWPVVVGKGTEVTISYHAPLGWSGATGYFGSATTPKPHTANGLTAVQGIYTYGAEPAAPTTRHYTNYLVDALYDPTEP